MFLQRFAMVNGAIIWWYSHDKPMSLLLKFVSEHRGLLVEFILIITIYNDKSRYILPKLSTYYHSLPHTTTVYHGKL